MRVVSVFDFLYARVAPQPGDAPAPMADLQPTPLLDFIAGEHAERIARVWPAPHVEFLALPAQRRHLAAMALAHAAPERHAHVRRVIESGQTREAIAAVTAHPPRGFARALARMGETLWTERGYQRVLALL